MKIVLSEPQIVSMGPKCREAGWGPYQFPTLHRLMDGRLAYCFNAGADSITDYGKPCGAYISEDNGKTWSPCQASDFSHLIGVPAGGGEYVRFEERTPLPLSEEIKIRQEDGSLRPITELVEEQKRFIVEDVVHPDFNVGYLFARNKAGEERRVVEGKFYPERLRTAIVKENLLARPFPLINHLRVSPFDGSLWLADYGICKNPETGELDKQFSNVLYRSTDCGYTWNMVTYLPYDPADFDFPDADKREGWGENDIGFAPDGSLFRIIRTTGTYYKATETCNRSSYITHSTDGGKTWTRPEEFYFCGVLPCILNLKCGVSLATYGRPGLFLRATADPSCKTWEKPIEIVHCDGRPLEGPKSVDLVATCGYADLIALDDHTAGLAYSNFTIEDENGVKRKCVMYRTITVVED